MGTWVEEYQQLVTDCLNRKSKISDWDAQFIDSINTQLSQERPLTPKQTNKLDEIWEKATKQG